MTQQRVNSSYISFQGIEFRVEIRDYMLENRVLIVRPDLTNPFKYEIFSKVTLTPEQAVIYINKFLKSIQEKWKNTQTSLSDSSPS